MTTYHIGDYVSLKENTAPFAEGFVTNVIGGSAASGPETARFEVTSPTGRTRTMSGKDLGERLPDPQLTIGGDYHFAGSLAQVTSQEGRAVRLRFGNGYESRMAHEVVIANKGTEPQS